MRRNPYIDALRGLSIVLVVVLHVQIRVRLQDSILFRSAPEVVWAFWCRNGHNGVRIFFVISGFLITS
ncbi:MAG TPA: acyltransferase family protein, partial [Polyangiaceae bacterium]|nr:acyltransferase family protein [Polyangiaceae bacterium]